ncbi:MAG: type II toxin-antitoxin system RelE/ParE family toxin [Methylobacter sp.]
MNNPKAAICSIGILKEKCQALADMRGIGKARKEYHDLHKFPVADYLIFYRPDQKGIEVIRILHGSLDIGAFF